MVDTNIANMSIILIGILITFSIYHTEMTNDD